MEFYRSIKKGHLYLLSSDCVYIIINGIPYVSNLTIDFIKMEEHASFIRVSTMPVGSL